MHRRALLAAAPLLALAANAPALAGAAPSRGPVFGARTWTLGNGMEVVLIASPRAPVAAQMVWYRVGAADEPQGHSGLAHFLEHLMFKGTETVPSGRFSKDVAAMGGRDNAFTGHDYTAYHQQILSGDLDRVMAMEADRMTKLILDADEIERERLVILEERRQVVEGNPRSVLREQMSAALWLNHPYGRPVIGWEEEIRGLPKDELVAFYRRHYNPANAILVVAGDVALDRLQALAETHYGSIPKGAAPSRIRPPEPRPRAARRLEITDPRAGEPMLSRRWVADSHRAGETKHALPLEIVAHVLGGGAGSRLHEALVEPGLAVSAGAWYAGDGVDLGELGASVSPRQGVERARVEAVFDETIATLAERGVTDTEVERAIRQMTAASAFARDGLMGGARTIGAARAVGIPIEEVEFWPEKLTRVDATAASDAARAGFRPEASVTGWLLPGGNA